ncbi:hypothetical protein ALISP_2789 [Alicycliphilus sp. B1]|nr:hypothetical protein ALISP_2789 [Alicycliphilus sp. B1]
MLDSRASQAMRWCVLRAAFHCGPSVVRPGRTAWAKASISVQQGAMSTASSAWPQGAATPDCCSSARASGAGWASTTASKPPCRWVSPPRVSQCSCQAVGRMGSRSMRVTAVCVCSRPSSASGSAQAWTSASMVGAATQCASPGMRVAVATRPAASSTRMVVALQARHRPGTVSRARWKRASRTVKYCAPVSKLPKGEASAAVRPPLWGALSNTVTAWPAWASVRAQAIPAMPAPTMAKRRTEAAGMPCFKRLLERGRGAVMAGFRKHVLG